MTSNLVIPKISKAPKMSDSNSGTMQAMIGKKSTKKIKFMSGELEMAKLTVAEVMGIQKLSKELDGKDDAGFDVLKHVIRTAITGASSISDAEFDGFPMDELTKLSSEIMVFSGIGNDSGK